MNLQQYRQLKQQRDLAQVADFKRQRPLCLRCRKALRTCYCSVIQPFCTKPQFVVLVHPKENRKRIGTARLIHLSIKNSLLFEGINFSQHPQVNALINNPKNFCVVLYPGPNAIDISQVATNLDQMVDPTKNLLVFILDGTWFGAAKMLRVSQNLKALSQIKFTPSQRSIYQIRQQPHEHCFASVEAVHFVIDKLKSIPRWACNEDHQNLIATFKHMIKQQQSFVTHPRQRAIRGLRQSQP